MSVTALSAGSTAEPPDQGCALQVHGDTVVVRHLSLTHAETAALLRRHLTQDGPDKAADLLRRAVPVGLVAVTMGNAAIDTGALGRTLDVFADKVDEKSTLAMDRLDATLTRLRQGEEAVALAAREVLAGLPQQVDAALAGEAGNVRAAVVEAARTVQADGMRQLSASLTAHSEGVRNALSLDRDGPVRALRQELVSEIHGTRRELAEHMTALRAMVAADQAQKVAGAKSTRAVGQEWEAHAMAIADAVVTAAGDRFEVTGSRPGPGTTRRTGDGVATLSAAVCGRSDAVRIVLEAKKRSRPMTTAELRKEVSAARQVRQAAAGIVLVPTVDEVPGEGRLHRLDDLGYVVAADDEDTVSLVYLITRELVARTILKQTGAEVDLTQVEARLALAMSALDEFDEVGRLATTAEKALSKLKEVGQRAQARARQAISTSIELMHP